MLLDCQQIAKGICFNPREKQILDDQKHHVDCFLAVHTFHEGEELGDVADIGFEPDLRRNRRNNLRECQVDSIDRRPLFVKCISRPLTDFELGQLLG